LIADCDAMLDDTVLHSPTEEDPVHPVVHESGIFDMRSLRTASRMDPFTSIADTNTPANANIGTVLVADTVSVIVSYGTGFDQDVLGPEQENSRVSAPIG
jgi:hypothetical protein